MFDGLFDRDRRRSRTGTRGWLDRLGEFSDHDDDHDHRASPSRRHADHDLDDDWHDDDRHGRRADGHRREALDWDD